MALAYSAAAIRLGVAGVAGIPKRDAEKIIGTFHIYSSEPQGLVR